MIKNLNIPNFDNHHKDVFKMIHLLDIAIKKNSREAFLPIITFLIDDCLAHFKEEEDIMRKYEFKDLKSHIHEHERYKNKIKEIKKMYDENIHTTHIAYSIRLLIDMLINHAHKVDKILEELINE